MGNVTSSPTTCVMCAGRSGRRTLTLRRSLSSSYALDGRDRKCRKMPSSAPYRLKPVFNDNNALQSEIAPRRAIRTNPRIILKQELDRALMVLDISHTTHSFDLNRCGQHLLWILAKVISLPTYRQ